jgi:hypothetical protein
MDLGCVKFQAGKNALSHNKKLIFLIGVMGRNQEEMRT